MSPTVSICIPCYNHGQYLKAAIDSALAQDYPHIEVIVSNNASTDNTAMVMASYENNSLVRLIHQPTLLSMTDHWNSFQKTAKGDWVMVLCSDDILLPNAIKQCINTINTQPSIDSVFFEYNYLQSDKVPDQVIEKTPFYQSSALIAAKEQFLIFLKGNNFPLTAALIKRSQLDQLNWFDTSHQFCADWRMWTQLTASTKSPYIGYIKTPLFLYRQHDQTETLKCISKKTTIGEIQKMKDFFINKHCPPELRAIYSALAQLGTAKLAAKYRDICKSLSQTELETYYENCYQSLSHIEIDIAPQNKHVRAPYELPPNSVELCL